MMCAWDFVRHSLTYPKSLSAHPPEVPVFGGLDTESVQVTIPRFIELRSTGKPV